MEQTILDAIYLFDLEAKRIENHKPGCAITFTLTVAGKSRYGDPAHTTLECQFHAPGGYQTVQAASLDNLIAEVSRRLGFADREAMRIDAINATLAALPAPTE